MKTKTETRPPVAGSWAGAVMRKSIANQQRKNRQTDGPTVELTWQRLQYKELPTVQRVVYRTKESPTVQRVAQPRQMVHEEKVIMTRENRVNVACTTTVK